MSSYCYLLTLLLNHCYVLLLQMFMVLYIFPMLQGSWRSRRWKCGHCPLHARETWNRSSYLYLGKECTKSKVMWNTSEENCLIALAFGFLLAKVSFHVNLYNVYLHLIFLSVCVMFSSTLSGKTKKAFWALDSCKRKEWKRFCCAAQPQFHYK